MKSKKKIQQMEDSDSPPSFNPADYPASTPRLVLLQKEYANQNTSASRKSELAEEISNLTTAQYGRPAKRKLVPLPLSSIAQKKNQDKLNKQEKRMAKIAKKQAAADANKPRQTRLPEMTMKQAMDRASELSRKEKGKILYVIVHEEDGNCGVSFKPNIPKTETHYAYKNGSQIAFEKQEPENEVEPKTKKEMKTTAKKSAAKKAAAPAPKKVSKASAKKAEEPLKGGKKITLTVKEIVAGMRKGVRYTNPDGSKKTLKYMSNLKNQDQEQEVLMYK